MYFPANDRYCLTMPCAGGRCTPICLIASGFPTCLLLLQSYKLMLSTVLLSQIPIANSYEGWCCYSTSDRFQSYRKMMRIRDYSYPEILERLDFVTHEIRGS